MMSSIRKILLLKEKKHQQLRLLRIYGSCSGPDANIYGTALNQAGWNIGAVSRCSLAMSDDAAFGQLDQNIAEGQPLLRAGSHWSRVSTE